MEFNIQNNILLTEHNSCIVIGVFEFNKLSTIAEKLDFISEGYISNLLRSEELEGKIGQTLLLYNVPKILSERILLVGCGKKELELNDRQYKQIIKKTINTLNKTGAVNAIYFLTDLYVKNRNNYWKIRQAVETVMDTLYVFDKFKSNKNETRKRLHKIIFNISTCHDLKNGELAIQHGMAISIGIKSAKDLANLPPNICNPAYLASKACQLADNFKNITTTVIGEKQMKDYGMNAYLAVGQGSKNESLMSIIEYKGSKNLNEKPIVIIGKGLTFDSGGISIKSSNNMDEMKYDMCGAATAYGIMRFIIELKLPINIIAVLAGCENMPSSKAYRPGDILTTMSGKTVEVLNTDAEGRLVICDTLTYIERFNPEVVIDVATLTGACMIALGNHYNGLMSNHDSLANELLNAGNQSGDKAWRLPLSEEFYEQLESKVADLANIGGNYGGAITAGCFLEKFANKYHWCHLDIAGTAWESGKKKGATGRPVTLLAQFLLNRIYITRTNE
ncbi:leucyl aminopeptidase [Arsenophonus endosymbiont of Lipoptena cervi]|uniref:leucyl aminopeptidase n=1 Tax=Arsenophonus endosymbiont of Lipoptena cervi TaxID=363258 RepID=UPI00376EB10C